MIDFVKTYGHDTRHRITGGPLWPTVADDKGEHYGAVREIGRA